MLGIYFSNSGFSTKFTKIEKKARTKKRDVHLSSATGKFFLYKRETAKPKARRRYM